MQSKGNNSAIKDDTPMKPHVHNFTMVIYIKYKFHELTSIFYLVMAADGKADGRTDGEIGRTDGKTEGQHQTNIPPPSAIKM